jgi:type I restriction enzyme M protein
VSNTARLCLKNLFLHNIGDLTVESPVTRADSLIADSGDRFAYVFSNPPFESFF